MNLGSDFRKRARGLSPRRLRRYAPCRRATLRRRRWRSQVLRYARPRSSPPSSALRGASASLRSSSASAPAFSRSEVFMSGVMPPPRFRSSGLPRSVGLCERWFVLWRGYFALLSRGGLFNIVQSLC